MVFGENAGAAFGVDGVLVAVREGVGVLEQVGLEVEHLAGGESLSALVVLP